MTTAKGKRGIRTRAIHAGESHGDSYSSAPDLVMSSTFRIDQDVSFSANKREADAPYVYTRWSNPTIAQLEASLADLENAEGAIAFATGMAASTAVLLHLLGQGDELVISDTNYPGTAEFARDSLPRYGVEVKTVDTTDLEAVRAAVSASTKLVWIETPSNPLLKLADIRAIADIAHAAGALLAVDSTFATPIATRPLDLGADLVIHSLTKFIGGHGDAMGGSVCGRADLLWPLRSEGLSHVGGVISPFNAWLILRGIATLPIRMQAHEANALELAGWLEQQPSVERVLYPGLESHPQHALAKQQMDNFSGIISFRVADPKAVAARMMRDFEVIHYAVSLGHHRSLMYLLESADLLPTSYRLEGKALADWQALAGAGLFRFSVGLEDPQDLKADLARVLDAD